MTSDWGSVRRVLAIRLDSMGDVLMTTPALRAIREAPGVEHLSLLTSPAGAAVAHHVSHVDETIVYCAPWMKASGATDFADDRAMIKQIASGHYDAAVIFAVFSQTPFPAAMLCRLAGIPLVLAYCRERSYALLSHPVSEIEPEQGIRHEVRRLLDLVGEVGWTTEQERLSLDLPRTAYDRVAHLVPEKGRWAVVHPGASAPSRQWPPEHYSRTIKRMHRLGWRMVLTGSTSERDLCTDIGDAAEIATDNLSGMLDFPELAALIDLAPLVITNNTGPAHLAAALQTPVVCLYALTNPQHTPWSVPSQVLSHDVPCRWCFASVCPEQHHLCLRGVTPDRVVAAANALCPPEQIAA